MRSHQGLSLEPGGVTVLNSIALSHPGPAGFFVCSVIVTVLAVEGLLGPDTVKLGLLKVSQSHGLITAATTPYGEPLPQL